MAKASPVKRVLAICSGGPLDGMIFSVALDGRGKPKPIESVGGLDDGDQYVATSRKRQLAVHHELDLWRGHDLVGEFDYEFRAAS